MTTSSVCSDVIWTQFNSEGQLCLRIIKEDAVPPLVIMNNVATDISLRASPLVSHFPVTVWEVPIPPNTQTINVGKTTICLPKKPYKKIALIGDTGCRPNQAWSADKWPFETIVKQIVADKPDLIIHLGDYIYRHFSAQHILSPKDLTPCEGDTWGGWQKEFFTPVKELLPLAPWIFIRGNQEGCDRAPFGWQLFLEGYPYTQNCVDYKEPFSVSLEDIDLIVHDSSTLAPSYNVDFPSQQLSALNLNKSNKCWLLTHRPLWGIIKNKEKKTDEAPLVIVNEHNYAESFLKPFPPNLTAIFSGHIHAFQYTHLLMSKIKQFVIGNSGVALEKQENALPTVLTDMEIDDKLIDLTFSINEFGYGCLEKTADKWTLSCKSIEGMTLKSFNL